jgi:small subunit ribosomal protein S11
MKNKKQDVRVKRREKKNVVVGVVHILATFNNTIVSITNLNGDVVAWSSAGAHGFKGSRKSTPYAAQITTEAVLKQALEHGLKSVSVLVKGPGGGREAAVRALMSGGVLVTVIRDVTPVAHNGCKPPKRRRV